MFHPDNISYMPVETLHCYQQRHNNLIEYNLTTGCWATATPNSDLIVMMEPVNTIVQHPIGETAPFGMDLSFNNRKYKDLVVACHLANHARMLEDHTLQVSSVLLLANLSLIALTELVCNLEPASLHSCNLLRLLSQKITVFPRKERLVSKQPLCFCPAGVCWQYKMIKLIYTWTLCKKFE